MTAPQFHRGVSTNVMPASAEMGMDIRPIPGPSDDKSAHQGNEFITISSLREVTSLYLHYILHFMA